MWHYFYTCNLKKLLKWLYPCITLSVKAINILILDIKVNCFRGNNPESNMKNHLFSPNFRCRKNRKNNSLVSPTPLYSQKTNYSIISYWSNGYDGQNTQYRCSCDIYLSTTYHPSVYYIIYRTLGCAYPGIYTEA